METAPAEITQRYYRAQTAKMLAEAAANFGHAGKDLHEFGTAEDRDAVAKAVRKLAETAVAAMEEDDD